MLRSDHFTMLHIYINRSLQRIHLTMFDINARRFLFRPVVCVDSGWLTWCTCIKKNSTLAYISSLGRWLFKFLNEFSEIFHHIAKKLILEKILQFVEIFSFLKHTNCERNMVYWFSCHTDFQMVLVSYFATFFVSINQVDWFTGF